MGWQQFFALVGLGVFICALFVIACGLSVALYRSRRERWRHKDWCDGIDHARAVLSCDAWWFSEDNDTLRVLQRLANGDDVSKVREEWRATRAARERTRNMGDRTTPSWERGAQDAPR
jgi:hypothetical protein